MRRRLTGTDPAASSMDRYSVRELGDLDLDLAKLTMTHFAGWRLPSAGRPSPATSDVVRSRVALTADGQVHGLVTLRASPHTATPGRTGLITAAAISADSEAPLLMRMLIIDAMLALASMNQESVEVALGAQHAELAALLRSLGFRHDQSDIRYELAESPRDMR